MNNTLVLNGITKNYGRIKALNNVSFAVPEGSVFGILGPNGSGKTTLLGTVMNVLQANAGTYRWFDEDSSEKQRQRIGTLLETPNFYHYLSGERNLQVAAAIKGRGENDIERVLKAVNLFERRHSKFSTFSLGMKQRLALASTLLGNPSVLVLDEPTNGLDPAGIAETRDLIKLLSKEGKTIILASHLLDEVEKVCTHVAILQKGNLITAGNVNEVLVNEESVEIGSDNPSQLLPVLQQMPGVKQVKAEGNFLHVFFDGNTTGLALINKYCFDHGHVLSHLVLRKKSLESKFIELTQNTSN